MGKMEEEGKTAACTQRKRSIYEYMCELFQTCQCVCVCVGISTFTCVCISNKARG